jgi:hypothetical protein
VVVQYSTITSRYAHPESKVLEDKVNCCVAGS